jgi:hypothetical protein
MIYDVLFMIQHHIYKKPPAAIEGAVDQQETAQIGISFVDEHMDEKNDPLIALTH